MSDRKPTSRRRLLTGGAAVVGSAAGAVLLGATNAEAADGGPLLVGKSNGSMTTTMLSNENYHSNTLGLVVRSQGGNAIEGRAAVSHGVSGVTASHGRAGVLATNNGPKGFGAALIANGNKNSGAIISSKDADNPALQVSSTVTDQFGRAPIAIGASASGVGGTGIVASGSTGLRVTGSATAIDAWGVDGGRGAEISAIADQNPLALKVQSLTPGEPHFPPVISGTAIQADGDVAVNGTLTKSSGAFRIDHPLDPANKYLSHSFVESPDMKNVYDGAVTADAKGEAAVELPDWFESLNKDLRYQLTAVGGPAPDLHVRTKVAKGRFTIGGAKPGQEVCWQVTGTRKDAWANAHRIEVEQAKPKKERGTYLFPKGFDQPETKRLGYRKLPTKR